MILKTLSGAARLVLFFIIQTVIFSFAGWLLVASVQPQAPAAEGANLFLVMILVQSVSLALIAGRSCMNRTGTAVLVTLISFVTGTVLTQIDSFVYLETLRGSIGYGIVALGAVTSVSGGVFAGLLFGGRVQGTVRVELPHNSGGWAGAMAVLALFHVVIYYLLGYYLVWIYPEARAWYGSEAELLGFAGHMATVFQDSWWIMLVQLVRGLGWALVAALIYRFCSGGRAGLTLLILLAFLAFHVIPLIVPNALMPPEIRALHLIELAATAVLMAGACALVLRPWGRTGGREVADRPVETIG